MRIAFIHPRYPFSDGTGATYSATQIVSGLAAVGHDVCVYCPREPDKKAQSSSLELRHLTGNSSHPHTTTRLNKEISARIDEFREFDVVHSYLMELIPSIGKVGRETNTSTIVTLNAYGGICAKNDLLYRDEEQCKSKSTQKCLSCIFRSGSNTDRSYAYQTTSQVLSLRLINQGERVHHYIDGYQALSTHVQNTYADFGFDSNKIETIPNILDEKFDVEHKSDFTEPIKLLYVGYLKHSKGADRLLDIISELNKQGCKQFELTIVGDGELRQSIEQERLGVGHDVCVYCPREPDKKAQSRSLELRHLTGNSSHPHTMTRLNKEISARIDEFREFNVVHSYLMGLIPSIGEVGQKTNTSTIVTLNAYGGICAKNDLLYRDEEQCESKSTQKCLHCVFRSGSNTDRSYAYQTTSQVLSLRLINQGERVRHYIDGYQALSTQVKNTYADFGFDSNKIETIPNILDEKFDVEHKSDLTEPIKLLYVGYLKYSKGADRLLDVVSELNNQCDKQFELTIVGDGELRQSIEQERLDRNLTETVKLTGQIPNDELPAIYAEHDIFLYPGRWDEPFGRIFLEAMAAGTPIVTTNIASVEEIIGEAGVVTEQSIQGLVDGVLTMTNEQRLELYAEQTNSQANKYKREKIIQSFEDLYRTGK